MQELLVRPFVCRFGDRQELLSFIVLESMSEHRTTGFVENLFPNSDHIVWRDSKNLVINGCVMELAKRESVTYRGDAIGFIVRDYMGCIEKGSLFERADCAARLVCGKHH